MDLPSSVHASLVMQYACTTKNSYVWREYLLPLRHLQKSHAGMFQLIPIDFFCSADTKEIKRKYPPFLEDYSYTKDQAAI